MIEEFYYYSCNFCNETSKNIVDFKRHVNSVHFPGNGDVPENVSNKDVVRQVKIEPGDDLQKKPGEDIF